MCIKIAGNVGRVIMLVINAVFLILGLASLVVGIIIQTDNKVLGQEEIVATLNKVTLSPGLKLGYVISALSLLVILLGVFAIVVSILGILGAALRNKPLIIIYIIVVLVVFLGHVVVLILWLVQKETVEDFVQDELTDALVIYNGVDATEDESVGWDHIFIDYKCCGVKAVTATNDQEFNKCKWWPNRGSDKVPKSCCKNAKKKDYKNAAANTACTVSLTDHNTKGCYEAIKENTFEYQTYAIVIGAILLFIECVGAVFAIVLVVSLGKNDDIY